MPLSHKPEHLRTLRYLILLPASYYSSIRTHDYIYWAWRERSGGWGVYVGVYQNTKSPGEKGRGAGGGGGPGVGGDGGSRDMVGDRRVRM